MAEHVRRDDHDESQDEGGEIRTVRARVHRLADTVQRHEGDIATLNVRSGEHGARIEMLVKTLESNRSSTEASLAALRANTPTKDDLKASETVLTTKLDGFHTQNTLKLDHLTDKIDPLISALKWAVTIVVGAVILALLATVLKGQ